MISLLRYHEFPGISSDRSKPFQHLDALRLLEMFSCPEKSVAEIGTKTNFSSLLASSCSYRYIIEPYNKAPGHGLSEIPALPYPIALFRCSVGQDSHIIPDKCFDISFSISVIEHIGQRAAGFDCKPTTQPPEAQEQERDAFVSELYRITAPGGITFHLVDHAARNLSFVQNFQKAGFMLCSETKIPTVSECLNDQDAVRQRVRWLGTEPMPEDEQKLHGVLRMVFVKPREGHLS